MANETRKTATNSHFDPYNFSEITKIQMDIERDLTGNAATELVASMASTENTLEAAPLPGLTSLVSSDGLNSPNGLSLADESFDTKFYTETIKQKAPPLPQLKSYRRLIIILLIICSLGTGTLGMGMGFGIVFFQRHAGISDVIAGNNLVDNAVAPSVGGTRLMFGSDGSAPSHEGSLADIVRLVDPAVVRITPVVQGQPPLPFFGQGNNNVMPVSASGIIFEKDDERVFIATKHHVTRGAREVYVSIMEHEPIQARPVGFDAAADLTVISVSLADVRRLGIDDIAIAAFGDSDSMQVGDVVLAIGNAMGEGNSTTSGIISAGEKELTIRERKLRVLQTDAAINPGSSGGPLVNKQGEVIGINTAIISTEHYAIEGMGFSIPSNVAKPIIEEIMNESPRPVLGIEGRTVIDGDVARHGLPPIGVLVTRVFEGSGAYEAGILRQDIITSFDNQAVFSIESLIEEIRRSGLGDTVEVTILRNGRQQITLQVTIGPNNNF
jgi:serine protease Do